MNRFMYSDKNRIKQNRKGIGLVLSVLVFVVILSGFYFGLLRLKHTSAKEEEASLRLALNEACVSCYAVEGFYPESLEYLIENYGISYDEARYFVDYKPIASNLMPDITIIVKKEKKAGGDEP